MLNLGSGIAQHLYILLQFDYFMVTEIQRILDYCQKELNLSGAKSLDENYFYNSLPLCVIDAVFSIGVNYNSVENVITRYCDYFKLNKIRRDKESVPSIQEQESVSSFCEKFGRFGLKYFVNNIFMNKQRTSSKNGILKTQAVYEFCQILKKHHIEYLQDVKKIMVDRTIEEEIALIKGQNSGISFKYFLMLAGSDEFIKPDRMVLRFLKDILGKEVTTDEAQKLVQEVSHKLNETYPDINPRLLDYQIWKFQSGRL